MKKLIVFSAFLCIYFAQAQQISGTTDLQPLEVKKYKTEIFTDVEKPAIFPAGIDYLRKTIAKKFKERKVKGKGIETCTVTFVIERDGTMTQIQASGTNESFNQEAVKSVSKIKEKWIPAELNGYKIRTRYKIPLTMNFE